MHDEFLFLSKNISLKTKHIVTFLYLPHHIVLGENIGLNNPLPSILYFFVFCIAIATAFFITLSGDKLDFIRLTIFNAPQIAPEQFTFITLVVLIIVISASFIMIITHTMVEENNEFQKVIEKKVDSEVKGLIKKKKQETELTTKPQKENTELKNIKK